MMAKAIPISRRDRPAKPALTRDGIVAAALSVMQAQGLERVTMRRLAQELDTGAASLYVYVRNTAELHALLIDELLGGLDLGPVTARTDWRDRLVLVLESYTLVLLQYPALAQSALVTRPSGPGYLALVEGLLALLRPHVAPEGAAWAVDLLLHHATSTAAEQGTRDRVVDSGQEEDDLVAALVGAPPDTYPNIAALGMDLMSGTGPDRLNWAFHVIINGILQTPTTRSDRPSSC